MSDARISSLFLVWTVVGIVAEVPTGALADRFSRRAALAAAGVLQAAGYALWTAVPGYNAFAAGFVLWGIGGAFGSGALEALLYDGLAAAGARDHYPRVYGRVTAMGLVGQLPNAFAATLLFATGGYPLVGWASVVCCLAAATLATRLPETRPAGAGASAGGDDDDPEPGYLDVLRSGVVEAARNPAVRAALVAVALLGGLDAIDEYFPLLAHDWGVSTAAVPLATTAIYLVGAAGAALGGLAHRLRSRTLAVVLALSVGLVGAAAVLRRPPAVAGLAVAYGLYHLVLVIADARLQRRIEGG
ncbi:MAG TPA: MFS transporter, partial [Acidimicrobiales bacterium]